MNTRPKVAAAGLAGTATVLVVWALGLFDITMDPEAASALTTLIAFAAGYIKSEPDPFRMDK